MYIIIDNNSYALLTHPRVFRLTRASEGVVHAGSRVCSTMLRVVRKMLFPLWCRAFDSIRMQRSVFAAHRRSDAED